MATTPEGYVKDEIKKILEAAKIEYSMKTTRGYGKSGWPDFDTVFRGIYVTIEAKYDADEKGPTALQRDVMKSIRASGGITLVLDAKNYHLLAKLIADTDKMLAATGYVTPLMVRVAATSLGIYYTEDVYGK